MYKIAKLSNDDRDAIFSKYEFDFGVKKAIVEKDFWVTFFLDYLFHKSTFKDYFVFKGGTSLSKCFNLISRFSEDVDLILKWHYLTDDDPNKERSKTKQSKYIEKINQLTQHFLKNNFLPILEKDLKQHINEDFKLSISPSEPQTVNFFYPRLYNHEEVGILQFIKIEIGTFGSLSQTEISMISPLIKNLKLPVLIDDATEVETVSVIRTFWEKITILHQEANRPKHLVMPHRYSRHYYDIYCIAHSKFKDLALSNIKLLKEVALYKIKFYPRTWAKYDEAYPPSLKLFPPKHRLKALEEDYLNMSEMIFGKRPSFDEMMIFIKELEFQINSL